MTAAVRSPVVDDPVLLAFAAEVGAEGPVAVEGGRTRWHLGGTPAPGTRLVRAPTGVVAVHADEMTVRVRAGTPVATLHAALAEVGQCSGLPERGGTVGGALAVGEDATPVTGARRVRETLLQVRYVAADGRVVTGGGPTVKNVSGYDLPRLLVGSLGTLGLLAEVLLRTDPVPAAARWLAADGCDPFAVDDALHRPAAVLWDGRRTWVRLVGHVPDVAAQAALLDRHGTWAEVAGPPPLPPHRWALRRSQLRALDHAVLGDHVASVTTGMVFAEQPQPATPPPPALAALAARVTREFDPTGRCNPGRDPALA